MTYDAGGRIGATMTHDNRETATSRATIVTLLTECMEQTDKLGATLSQLEDRLEPVRRELLGEEGPGEPDEQASPLKPSPLNSKLRGHRAQIRNIQRRIAALNEAVEL